jgi:hypothetical protein
MTLGIMDDAARPAEPGELCTCGRPAVQVFTRAEMFGGGEVGWCGIADGGAQAGPCPFCGAPSRHGSVAGTAVCPKYRLKLET